MRYETKRHKELKRRFNAANTQRKNITKRNIDISKTLGVSVTTVYNYTLGKITDPYLAEDILSLIEQEK